MKLSKIIAAGIATVAMSAIMCISAYAATEFKISRVTSTTTYDEETEQDITTTTARLEGKSSDYSKIASLGIKIGFDSSKYTVSSVSKKGVTAVYNANYPGLTGCYITLAAPSGIELKSDDYTLIALIKFSNAPSDASVDDFSIVGLDKLSYFEGDSIDPNNVSDLTEAATYVRYKFPVTVEDSWDKGYIQALKAVVKSGSNTLATVPLKNYYIEDGNYVFVLKLVPSTQKAKTTVDIDIQASLSPAKDTAEANWTTDVIDTISGIAVEYLQ